MIYGVQFIILDKNGGAVPSNGVYFTTIELRPRELLNLRRVTEKVKEQVDPDHKVYAIYINNINLLSTVESSQPGRKNHDFWDTEFK